MQVIFLLPIDVISKLEDKLEDTHAACMLLSLMSRFVEQAHRAALTIFAFGRTGFPFATGCRGFISFRSRHGLGRNHTYTRQYDFCLAVGGNHTQLASLPEHISFFRNGALEKMHCTRNHARSVAAKPNGD